MGSFVHLGLVSETFQTLIGEETYQIVRQMSAWLGRPFLINQKDCDFVFPNLRLDESASQPNLLSPFAHMALQAMLGRRISQFLGDHPTGTALSAEQVFGVQKECEGFIEELPAVFRINNPDLSLDGQHPYYVFQRCQLHVVIYTVQFDFLKPYLTRSPTDRLTAHDGEFRFMGIDLSLRLLNVARSLFDHEFPINAKFHLVVFCVFDTATILCSAIIHDTKKALPRRDNILDRIEDSLNMLHQLSFTTKIGASSYNFLMNLVQASPVLSRYAPIQKRQRINTISPNGTSSESTEATPSDTNRLVSIPETAIAPALPAVATVVEPSPHILFQSTHTAMEPLPQVPVTDDLNFDLDQFLQQNPLDNHDMGGLEQIWDWENLHLDGNYNPGFATSQA